MPLNVTFDYNLNEIPPLADGDHKSTVKLTSYMENSKRRVSMPPKDCSAVEVRRLRYVVGRGKKAKVILSGINMTVPEGAIYGLLGPSGSGKTTLLKSVVGQLTPTEGWVKVFGFQPNQPGSQIPGSAIGYMPQELAVYEDFTIKETLWYFGRLYRIPSKLIKERIEFLLTFLDLPRSKRLILNMSGGQKRRVSLASALVHSPPLLILDEPTVGVDPLLRQSIWQHLVTLTQTEKITVIVTTHYIEEARRANIVGLMRRGKLLAENAPEDLMAKHDSSSLEDVFLKLCVSDTMRRAQKFASLTGMPMQIAIAGTNSVVPTPEIQSKRTHHYPLAIGDAIDGPQSIIVVGGGRGVGGDVVKGNSNDTASSGGEGSQSPDEGVNTSSSANHSSSSNSSNSGNLDQDNCCEEPHDSSASTSSSASDQPPGPLPSAPPRPPKTKSASSASAHRAVDNQTTGDVLATDRSTDVSVATTAEAKDSNSEHRDDKATSEAQSNSATCLTSKSAKKFHLKSLLKLAAGGQKANSNGCDDDDARMQSTAKMRQQLEHRRQSGSHFIEQLMSKYDQEQQNGLNCRPLSELLSCDTTIGASQQQQQKMVGNSSHKHRQLLNVPKIAVHGSNFGDSGASSNGSSQNNSPVGGIVQPLQQQQQQLAGAYANLSYQPSECGSTTYTDVVNGTNNNNATSNKNNCLNIQQQQQQQQHKQMQLHYSNRDSSGGCKMITENLDDDVILDPELFMNPADLSTMSPGNKYDYKKQSVREYCDTISVITWKNYIRLKRNVPLLLFQFVLPAIQVILFCICVGNDPFDIPVAVVNEESSADSIAAMSTQFLKAIDTHLVRQVNFTNLPSAIESVRLGKNWGVIHIPENFTLSIHKRFAGLEGELDDVTLENSTIKVYPDMTNQPIGHAMEVAFRRAYNDLSKQTFEFLGLNPAQVEAPIRMQDAIYGKIDMQNYLQYMSPGVLISISYIMATGLTSLAFIIERRDGLYDRTLAAGVGHVQMLLSHSIVQLLVMIVQISLVVFFTFVIYKVPTNGPFVWVFLLLLLQGLAGMSFGLMVSAICKEENTAIMMILGTFYPNLLLAGVIWPIEAIPYWLRWFSYLQPQTLPTQSLRDLIVRGWDIDQPGVWSGFAVTTIWLILFLAISCISFRIKK